MSLTEREFSNLKKDVQFTLHSLETYVTDTVQEIKELKKRLSHIETHHKSLKSHIKLLKKINDKLESIEKKLGDENGIL